MGNILFKKRHIKLESCILPPMVEDCRIKYGVIALFVYIYKLFQDILEIFLFNIYFRDEESMK